MADLASAKNAVKWGLEGI